MEKKTKTSNYDLQVDLTRKLFLEYDQEKLIDKFQLNSDGDWIYLTYLNVPCRICRSSARVDECIDGVWSECRFYNTVMTIYDLLCHNRDESAPSLSGSWCTIGSFVVTGVQDAGGFTKKYAELFQDRAEDLAAACVRLGGTLKSRMAGADVTCEIPITSFFSVLLQFWDGDDEFPPKLTLMWDRNTIRFLHFETTFFLQGDLLERLKRMLEQ